VKAVWNFLEINKSKLNMTYVIQEREGEETWRLEFRRRRWCNGRHSGEERRGGGGEIAQLRIRFELGEGRVKTERDKQNTYK